MKDHDKEEPAGCENGGEEILKPGGLSLVEEHTQHIDLDKEVCNGSVKVMLSYNFCHFEVCLGVVDGLTLQEVNELRKDAQRLAEEAVRQYKAAKSYQQALMSFDNREYHVAQVQRIREEVPESEWSPQQQAIVKALEDDAYRQAHPYAYDDDWEETNEDSH